MAHLAGHAAAAAYMPAVPRWIMHICCTARQDTLAGPTARHIAALALHLV